jgi:hypothetical protein
MLFSIYIAQGFNINVVPHPTLIPRSHTRTTAAVDRTSQTQPTDVTLLKFKQEKKRGSETRENQFKIQKIK